MASKDNKTSKTARVMNLLSKKQDSAPAGEAAETTAPATSAAVPPIVASLAPDAAISAQIKDALEGALEGELGPLSAPAQAAPAQPKPAVAEPPVEAPQPAEQAAPVQPEPEPAPEPTPVSESVPAQPEAASQPEPAAQPETPAEPAPAAEKTFSIPKHPGYINVMQVLVDEKAEKYIKMFGLCQCERCKEDVKALTLNNLPPKYVVMEEGDWISRLTVYEGRYNSDITAQLLHACQVVLQTPHHGR